MSRNLKQRMRASRGMSHGLAMGVALVFGGVLLGGCEVDSYFDPSVVGRWEQTPTVVPILDRIAVIEGAEEQAVEYTEVKERDLVPEIDPYRAKSGDVLEISILGLFQSQVPEPYQRRVDAEGMVDLPQIGPVYIHNMTQGEMREAIAQKMEQEQIATDPVISIVPLSQRQRQFNLIGSVSGPGTYQIPFTDYRLLQALSAGGSFNQNAEYVYVIRQVPLTPEAAGETRAPADGGSGDGGANGDGQAEPSGREGTGGQPSGDGDDLLDVIDELSEPAGEGSGNGARGGSPGAMPMSAASAGRGGEGATGAGRRPARVSRGAQGNLGRAQPAEDDGGGERRQPLVDLIEEGEGEGAGEAPSRQPRGAGGHSGEGETDWKYVDGRWVPVPEGGDRQGGSRDGGGDGGDGIGESRPGDSGEPGGEGEEPMLTQRIIRVPLQPLLDGDAKHNIVIRSGDTVRVPVPPTGTIFMMGQIARPGAFQMSQDLTLTNAIASAGGLAGTAIPERVDLTRMVGDDRAATIRLDLRAIMDGTQPDIYLKRNDRINVGTNFWALPLAVIRGGFRTNYGFGFLLDRNFGNDVFGPPPTNRGGGVAF